MKGKILSIVVFLLLCTSVLMSTAQAAKPIAQGVTTEILDGPFNGFYAKGVLHGVLIGRYIGEEDGLAVVKVKITMIQKLNIYTLDGEEAGEFLGTMNLNLEYQGIVHIDSNGMMTMWTGTYAGTWVINGDVPIPMPEGATYKGHTTRIYRDGLVVKKILKGVPPFELP